MPENITTGELLKYHFFKQVAKGERNRFLLHFRAFLSNLSVYKIWNVTASGIKCWICNNLAQPWCNDPLDLDQIGELEKSLADCPSDKCVKISEITCKWIFFWLKSHDCNNEKTSILHNLAALFVNMKPTISRFCANSPAEAVQLCNRNDTGKRDFKCEICDTDGCNGAVQYGPVALLVLIPVAIAQLFAFWVFLLLKIIFFRLIWCLFFFNSLASYLGQVSNITKT